MNLLDFPPETLQNIICRYVNIVGISEAWKSRIACKTFAIYVKHEILAKQPIRSFLKKKEIGARQVLKMCTAPYLEYRSKSLNGAHKLLPAFIATHVNELAGNNNSGAHQRRATFTYILSELLVREFQYVYALIIHNGRNQDQQFKVKYLDSNSIKNKVAAAAASGAINTIQDCVTQCPEVLWERSTAFGYPLSAAAFAGEYAIVKILTNHYQYSRYKILSHNNWAAFRSAIDVALERRHFGIVKLLLEIVSTHFPINNKFRYNWLVKISSMATVL